MDKINKLLAKDKTKPPMIFRGKLEALAFKSVKAKDGGSHLPTFPMTLHRKISGAPNRRIFYVRGIACKLILTACLLFTMALAQAQDHRPARLPESSADSIRMKMRPLQEVTRMKASPLLPDRTLPEPFPTDPFPPVSPLALPDLSHLQPLPPIDGIGATTITLPGLMDARNVCLMRNYTTGRFDFTAGTALSKINSAWGFSQNNFSVDGMVRYQVNDRIKIGFYGQYAPTADRITPLFYPICPTHQYGMRLDLKLNEHWSIFVKRGLQFNPMRRKWEWTTEGGLEHH